MPVAYDAAYAPDLGAVHANGGIAVNHYLTGIYAGTSTQPVDAHKHGLGSIITYEQGPSELVGLSRAGGRDVGNRILAAVRKLGVPLDGSVAVYPSVDVNVATDRMSACDQAYKGLRDVLAGKLSIRCYGEFDLIKHLHDAGLTDGPGWLAGASSWSSTYPTDSPLVCMVQHVGSDIPSTDRNTVTQPRALGAWWPTGSPFIKEDDVSAQDVLDALASDKGKALLRSAIMDAPLSREPNDPKYAVSSWWTGAGVSAGNAAASAKAAAASAAAATALITELGKRVASLQAANDDQSKQIAALQAQVADLASGKFNVSGTIPATLVIGAQ